MKPGHPPGPVARKRVASVWVGVAVLVALVLVLYTVHAMRTYALLHERAHDEARPAGMQAALQISAQLRHVGDVVLHTKVAFDEFGPGLMERDPVTQARAPGSVRECSRQHQQHGAGRNRRRAFRDQHAGPGAGRKNRNVHGARHGR